MMITEGSRGGTTPTTRAQEKKGVNRVSMQVEKRANESMSYGITHVTRVVFVYPFESTRAARPVASRRTRRPRVTARATELLYHPLHYSAYFGYFYVPCPRLLSPTKSDVTARRYGCDIRAFHKMSNLGRWGGKEGNAAAGTRWLPSRSFESRDQKRTAKSKAPCLVRSGRSHLCTARHHNPVNRHSLFTDAPKIFPYRTTSKRL